MEKEEILEKIQLLKKQLTDSQRLRSKEAKLGQLRLKLEEQMMTLDPKTALFLNCQSKMLEIDHTLDELEEWTDEKVLSVKEELISLILRLHPKQQTTYNNLSSRLIYAQKLHYHIEKVQGHLRQILEAINAMVTKRQEVKRRGVLSYVLGSNPNVVIGRCLQEICNGAESCLSCEPKSEALREELAKVATSCQQRWGFKTIDKIFIPMQERFLDYIGEQDDELTNLNEEILDLERQIKSWIEQYSQ